MARTEVRLMLLGTWVLMATVCLRVLDVVIVVDGSSNVGYFEDELRTFLADFVGRLVIGEDDIRVGMVLYSSDATTVFDLDTYTYVDDIIDEIYNLDLSGSDSNLAGALLVMRTESFTSWAGDREYVPNVAIVLQSSYADTNWDDIASEAALSSAQGIKIKLIAVGVEDHGWADLWADLVSFAFFSSEILTVEYYDDLPTILESLVSFTCCSFLETDIDECAEETDDCDREHGDCENTDGSYICNCNAGYTGRRCSHDINECYHGYTNTCQHRGLCKNTVGSFTCNCDDTGYKGNTCAEDIDECLSSPCRHGGACQNQVARFSCNCDNTGYEGDTCDTDIDECTSSTTPHECLHNGTCENTDGSYDCKCSGTGFNGDYCETDIDECEDEVDDCHGPICMNTIGSYSCDCTEGYELQGKTECIDIDECVESNGGCDHVCNNSEGSYTCSCRVGYALLSDKHTCIDIDECTLTAEHAHDCRDTEFEVCKNTAGSFDCDCFDGYTRTDSMMCEKKISERDSDDSATAAGIGAGVGLLVVVIVSAVIILAVYCIRRRARAQEGTANPRDNSHVYYNTRTESDLTGVETADQPQSEPEDGDPYDELDVEKMYTATQREAVSEEPATGPNMYDSLRETEPPTTATPPTYANVNNQ